MQNPSGQHHGWEVINESKGPATLDHKHLPRMSVGVHETAFRTEKDRIAKESLTDPNMIFHTLPLLVDVLKGNTVVREII